jgi:hypothetical protein
MAGNQAALTFLYFLNFTLTTLTTLTTVDQNTRVWRQGSGHESAVTLTTPTACSPAWQRRWSGSRPYSIKSGTHHELLRRSGCVDRCDSLMLDSGSRRLSGEIFTATSQEVLTMDVYRVLAHWDENAQVWWAESDEVPGLASEAPTFEALDENVRSIAPELLMLNKGITGTFRVDLIRD